MGETPSDAKQIIRRPRPALGWRRALLCGLVWVHAASSHAEVAGNPLVIDFQPRTPEQISAFYAARAFPPRMVEILAEQCFITVRIHNTGSDVVWLELANWQFSAAGKAVHRPHRDVWKARWQAMQIPLASQSTFRWTLLPETLDFQPNEQEGGNIILPPTEAPLSLEAEFATGADKSGPRIRLRFDDLTCARSSP